MLILAIADRSPRENLLDLITQSHVDLICTLGDLNYFFLRELEAVTTTPKIGVYGNHCSGNYFELLNIHNLHLRTFEYGGLVFGGFEGSVRYKQSPYAKMYTQEEAQALLQNFPKVDVFLAHSPAYGINDEPNDPAHQGFIAIRDYLTSRQPKYFLHGHTYPNMTNLIKKYGNTNVVYVHGAEIVEIY
jgi:Predicted phosphoesterases, related to the Icc protein